MVALSAAISKCNSTNTSEKMKSGEEAKREPVRVSLPSLRGATISIMKLIQTGKKCKFL